MSEQEEKTTPKLEAHNMSGHARIFSGEEAKKIRELAGIPNPMDPKPTPESQQAIGGREAGQKLKRDLEEALKAQQNNP